MANVYDIIIRPIITERSMEATGTKKYVFEGLPPPVRSRSRTPWRRSSA